MQCVYQQKPLPSRSINLMKGIFMEAYLVRAVQHVLKDLGLMHKEPDGDWDKRTQEAYTSAALDHGLPPQHQGWTPNNLLQIPAKLAIKVEAKLKELLGELKAEDAKIDSEVVAEVKKVDVTAKVEEFVHTIDAPAPEVLKAAETAQTITPTEATPVDTQPQNLESPLEVKTDAALNVTTDEKPAA